jgi:transcriptional regulator with XRE-family HTH domain
VENKLGVMVKSARENKGLTQQQLAENTRISRSYLADIESGRYNPSSEKLIILAKNLNLDLNLLKNDGNTDRQNKDKQ